MHENRETSEIPAVEQITGRREKANGRTSRMYVCEGSDSGVVPMNHSNKDGRPSAESEEGRLLIKENIHQLHTFPTQSGMLRVPEADECAVIRSRFAAIIRDRSRVR
jgi:hypothetical protein